MSFRNLTQFLYPGKLNIVPLTEAAMKVMFYGIIIVSSLVGNVLLIVIVLRQKRLRTVTNFYLVNLAVADLLVTLCCSWVHLVDNLTEGWVLGAFFCKFNSFSQVLVMVVSVLTLALIAYDRFFGIVFALKAHLTERKAKKSLIFVWTCAFAVACPMIVYRQVFSRHWANHVEIWCDDKWPVESYFDPALNHTVTASPSRKIYYTFVSVVLFFIPMAIMTIAYSVIICRLRGSAMPGERIEREVAIQAKIKRKVVIMLIVILVLFGVCWLPYMISILYPEYREVSSHQLGVWYFNLQFTALYLAHSNAALNPLIYVGLNENFRQGLKDTFRCMRARRSEEFILGRTYSVYNSTSVSRV